jgi:hypothetical protein
VKTSFPEIALLGYVVYGGLCVCVNFFPTMYHCDVDLRFIITDLGKFVVENHKELASLLHLQNFAS